jgi:hypothetical protein
MAKAFLAKEETKIVKEVIVEKDVVSLRLSLNEARTLGVILGCVGGSPKSWRRHADSILEALRQQSLVPAWRTSKNCISGNAYAHTPGSLHPHSENLAEITYAPWECPDDE